MSFSTPSKEQGAERHLMRVRGAGKVARDINGDLFAFTIAARSVQNSVEQQADKGRPLKRAKTKHEEAGLLAKPSVNTRGKHDKDISVVAPSLDPHVSTTTASTKLQPSIVHVNDAKAASKARAREAAKKLFDEPQVKVRSRTKPASKVPATRIDGADAVRLGRGDSARMSIPKPRTTLSETEIATVITHSCKTNEKLGTDMTNNELCVTSARHALAAAAAAAAPVSLLVQNASKPILSPALPKPTACGSTTTAATAQVPENEKRKLTIKMRPLSPIKRAKRIHTTRISAAPTNTECTVPISKSVFPTKIAVSPAEDVMESLPNKTSTAPRLRSVLAGISPNRIDLVTYNSAKHTKDEISSDPPVKLDNMKRGQERATVSPRSRRTFHITQPGSTEMSATVHAGNLPTITSFTTLSKETTSGSQSRTTSRKRIRSSLDDDVDLDDLLTNITTSTQPTSGKRKKLC
ncbi:hypothetical protein AMS68_003503 [Peltaster fructicola]|uniref:Uncharacterized protein n=1 Tax=Peltaster fructicola TaxID=286661 RepID=A0A6H0XTI6_9PEZI|nr:hypothetical protein AMS68_003503 [Peltaster fructicola]